MVTVNLRAFPAQFTKHAHNTPHRSQWVLSRLQVPKLHVAAVKHLSECCYQQLRQDDFPHNHVHKKIYNQKTKTDQEYVSQSGFNYQKKIQIIYLLYW